LLSLAWLKASFIQIDGLAIYQVIHQPSLIFHSAYNQGFALAVTASGMARRAGQGSCPSG